MKIVLITIFLTLYEIEQRMRKDASRLCPLPLDSDCFNLKLYYFIIQKQKTERESWPHEGVVPGEKGWSNLKLILSLTRTFILSQSTRFTLLDLACLIKSQNLKVFFL